MTTMATPPDLDYRRQSAIDVCLRLMGCTDDKQSNCEHVAALIELASACYATIGAMTGVNIEAQAQFRPDARGKREGRLR